jgi:phosphate transport system protein
MSRHFLHALEDLHREVLLMGGNVEATVARAVRAILDRDVAQANEVIEGDREINLQELKIDEECLKMLALYQPTARDLRFVTGVMKIINDLERVADLSVNIAERALELAQGPPRELPAAFVALGRRDAAKAMDVLRMDDPIDALLRGIFDELEAAMTRDPKQIRPDLLILSAAKNLERIADHASNIAEDVVYMVDGNIIRHMH